MCFLDLVFLFTKVFSSVPGVVFPISCILLVTFVSEVPTQVTKFFVSVFPLGWIFFIDHCYHFQVFWMILFTSTVCDLIDFIKVDFTSSFFKNFYCIPKCYFKILILYFSYVAFLRVYCSRASRLCRDFVLVVTDCNLCWGLSIWVQDDYNSRYWYLVFLFFFSWMGVVFLGFCCPLCF